MILRRPFVYALAISSVFCFVSGANAQVADGRADPHPAASRLSSPGTAPRGVDERHGDLSPGRSPVAFDQRHSAYPGWCTR